MKRIISAALCFAMLFSLCLSGHASEFTGEKISDKPLLPALRTDCGGQCNKVPTIIIPGLSQSNVWLVDDNGDFVLDENGNKIDCFPCYAKTKPIVKRVIFPLLATLFTGHNFMNKALDDVVDMIFYMNEADDEGNESKYGRLEEYPYSLAECSEYEKSEIYDAVPIQSLGREYEDHLYFFAYNSFGNNIQIVDRLYRFIQTVKAETGHSKVNLVPISLGGTVANGLLEYYSGRYEGKESVYNSINKIIYVVPALDGSSIIGDIMTKSLSFLDPDYLYNGFLEGLMDEKSARLVEIALRILPDKTVMSILDHLATALDKKVFSRSTNMWALCPAEDYEKAAGMWLSDTSMKKIREQTDLYQSARLNSRDNIQKINETGVQVFDLVEYEYPMYNIGVHWNSENGDGIIDLDSTSMGAVSARVGETLPDDYVQNDANCSEKGVHCHISPDRKVDASAALLPETTFYFSNISHEDTSYNDKLMRLAIELIKGDSVKNVHSSELFPQFTDCADIGLSEGEGGNEENEASKFRDISLWLFDHFGTKGFVQMPFYLIKNLFSVSKQ
ncbi:MAG: hypothetical protein K6B52_02265 [Clostridiales bacterium]|nr:hypothetical protein [Clostridiales bacterium]